MRDETTFFASLEAIVNSSGIRIDSLSRLRNLLVSFLLLLGLITVQGHFKMPVAGVTVTSRGAEAETLPPVLCLFASFIGARHATPSAVLKRGLFGIAAG